MIPQSNALKIQLVAAIQQQNFAYFNGGRHVMTEFLDETKKWPH